jgi:hypothetical protein
LSVIHSPLYNLDLHIQGVNLATSPSVENSRKLQQWAVEVVDALKRSHRENANRSRVLKASQRVPWPSLGPRERFTFGICAVPKPSARDVLGGFEPVVNYSVRPLASTGGPC